MATIASIKQSTNARIRIKSKPNTVSTGDVADNLDLIADEVRSRGFIKTASTLGLSSISGSNTRYAIVQSNGLYEYSPGGSANGTTIFDADGGGTWNQIAQFAEDLTEKYTVSAAYKYELGAQFQITTIRIKPSVQQTIKAGFTNGGEEVLMQDVVEANETRSIQITIYGDEHSEVWFTGIDSSTDITIYKKRL